MNRQQSQMMKGVAILLMIFLHLFNQRTNVDMCHNFISIDGNPLVLILSRAANPVAFFLILGGYGLYKVNEKGDRHRWSRLLKLYLHYWLILLAFVTIGHFISPQAYPGSFLAVLGNATGFETTYNGEMWFLLPYAILSALAPWLFRLMARFRAVAVVAATLFIHLCTSFCISRYGTAYLYHDFIYSLSYPLLIFATLTAISYACSLIVNAIALPIEKRLMPKNEIKEKPIL